jgi:DNA-binding SARP family transcriptional activator
VVATHADVEAEPALHGASRYGLHLLGAFRATDRGAQLLLPPSTSRLVAFLAIARRPVERTRVANALWTDKSEERAHANLRSCLWRVRQTGPGLIACTPTHLRIGEDVWIDVSELERAADGVADPGRSFDPDGVDTMWFSDELLPDWYDDFIEVEREQFRQLRLHSLELLATRLLGIGRPERALTVAFTAITAAPLRESAHRLVMSIHLSEGNVAEAIHQFVLLRTLLDRHLGAEPSQAARQLVSQWLPADWVGSAPVR